MGVDLGPAPGGRRLRDPDDQGPGPAAWELPDDRDRALWALERHPEWFRTGLPAPGGVPWNVLGAELVGILADGWEDLVGVLGAAAGDRTHGGGPA